MKYYGIKISKDDHPTRPYLVNVAKSLFGKQIRKRFTSRNAADDQVTKYGVKLKNKERTPLEPEIHKTVALFQGKLSAAQIMMALTDAVELHGLSSNTLEELGNEFITHQKMLNERGSLGDIYTNDCEHMYPKMVKYLGNPQVNAITTEDLDNFVDTRLNMKHKNGKPHSPRTVKNEVNLLSSIFNYAIGKKYVTDNPTLKVILPSYKAEGGICQPEDLENLLSHACHYIQCWIMFGAFGGLRSSEIFRMKWSDVRLDEGQFYIAGKKNEGAERWIKMTPPLMDFCKAILEGEDVPDGLVMGGMSQTTRDRKMRQACRKAGYKIPKNGLRHSFGSHHLVHYQNGDNTANEMGHVGPQQTFKGIPESGAEVAGSQLLRHTLFYEALGDHQGDGDQETAEIGRANSGLKIGDTACDFGRYRCCYNHKGGSLLDAKKILPLAGKLYERQHKSRSFSSISSGIK